MDSKLVKALNKQVNSEFYSAYLYLSMAAHSESINLPGFSQWFKVQVQEEISHAMKIYGFLNDRGEKVKLEAISGPPSTFSSPVEMFKGTLAHEKKVTAMIDDLYTLANKVKDNAAIVMLQWFITEQVEEEKNAATILDTLKKVEPDSAALIMLDHELGARQVVTAA